MIELTQVNTKQLCIEREIKAYLNIHPLVPQSAYLNIHPLAPQSAY
jgi:hypothetical protein